MPEVALLPVCGPGLLAWTVVIPEMTLREVQLLSDLGQEEKQLELEDIFIKVTGL